MNQIDCLFCKSNAKSLSDSANRRLFYVNCPICTEFGISTQLWDYLKDSPLSVQYRVNCVYRNILDNDDHVTPIWITQAQAAPEISEGANVRRFDEVASLPILHSSKQNDILLATAKKLIGDDPFAEARFSEVDLYRLKISGYPEFVEWIIPLMDQRLLNGIQLRSLLNQIGGNERLITQGSNLSFQLTPSGWLKVEDLNSFSYSREGFIAMAFGLPNRTEVQKAIEAACKQCNWFSTTVDRAEFIGSVMDEIKAKINRARFVVADFSSHRNGVYYEAGYAEGLGIKVIYTVHKNDESNMHFDTRHLNHIVWETPEDLARKLINRIGAVINFPEKRHAP